MGKEKCGKENNAHRMKIPCYSHKKSCERIFFFEKEHKGEDIKHDGPLYSMVKEINVDCRGPDRPLIELTGKKKCGSKASYDRAGKGFSQIKEAHSGEEEAYKPLCQGKLFQVNMAKNKTTEIVHK